MTDYVPILVTEMDVRNFFTPPIDYDDLTKAELLLKIESVEDFIKAEYDITSATDAKIPALLLIAAKIIQSPKLARKYYTLNSEKLGDYSYTISQPATNINAQSNPYLIALTWEQMAYKILNKRANNRWGFTVVND